MEQKEGRTGGRQRMQEVEHEVIYASREVMAWVCVVWSKWEEGTEEEGPWSGVNWTDEKMVAARMALGMTSRSQPWMAIRL